MADGVSPAVFGPVAPPAGQGVSRKEVLRRYREVLHKSSKDATHTPYLGDVVGLSVTVDEKTHHNLTELGA